MVYSSEFTPLEPLPVGRLRLLLALLDDSTIFPRLTEVDTVDRVIELLAN